MGHAYRKGGMTDSTWNAYDGQMTTPLLRCAPLATPRGRCHGVNEEHMRRGARNGSPFSFLAQEFQKRGTARVWQTCYQPRFTWFGPTSSTDFADREIIRRAGG